MFTGRATKVMKSPSRAASFVFSNQNDAHAVGSLPDDYDTVVVHKRQRVDAGRPCRVKGVSVPIRWHKTDPNSAVQGQPRRADQGYHWFGVKTGKKVITAIRVSISMTGFSKRTAVAAHLL